MILPDFLAKLMEPNPTPCTHFMSFRMADGKWFCMCCRKVSDTPLRVPRTGDKA